MKSVIPCQHRLLQIWYVRLNSMKKWQYFTQLALEAVVVRIFVFFFDTIDLVPACRGKPYQDSPLSFAIMSEIA